MKIPRLGQHAHISRVAACGLGEWIGCGHLRQLGQFRRPVDHGVRHQVNDAFLAALHLAVHLHQPCGHDGAPLPLHQPRPKQDVHDPAFVLDGDEHRVALSGPLPHQHDACGLHLRAVFGGVDGGATEDVFLRKAFAQKLHRMAFQRQSLRLIIRSDMFLTAASRAGGHRVRRRAPWHRQRRITAARGRGGGAPPTALGGDRD